MLKRGTGTPEVRKMLQTHENINVGRQNTNIEIYIIIQPSGRFSFLQSATPVSGYESNFAYFSRADNHNNFNAEPRFRISPRGPRTGGGLSVPRGNTKSDFVCLISFV